MQRYFQLKMGKLKISVHVFVLLSLYVLYICIYMFYSSVFMHQLASLRRKRNIIKKSSFFLSCWCVINKLNSNDLDEVKEETVFKSFE